MDQEEVMILVIIQLHIVGRWLCKLRYRYKDVCKDMLIDKHEQPDVIGDYKVFLNKIEELKSYIVEFNKSDVIEPKIYLIDYIIEDNNWQPIIIITYNKYTFSANNRIQKVLAQKGDTFQYPNNQD